MKTKKMLLGLILAAVLVLGSALGMADNSEAALKEIVYGSFSGTVKEIAELESEDGSKIVHAERWDGEIADIIISKDTYVVDGAELAVGASITAFYDAEAPMIMIYPPQYSALIVAVTGEKNANAVVDRFDEDLVSSDNSLKLILSKDTLIVTRDGEKYEGELSHCKLLVIYGITTKSIPAQTTPVKIVVLSEKTTLPDVSAMEIIVNGKVLDAPAAYTNKKGTVMIPLRAVAEALGYDVQWYGETRSVTLSSEISMTIAIDSYSNKGAASIRLGTAPELTESRTFVPLSFFRDVLNMNNAYVFEGQIVIDNEEKMQ
ncbi:MAG: copper amine oxidase N-terminal domain-containing protein [Bacillota bacterium]